MDKITSIKLFRGEWLVEATLAIEDVKSQIQQLKSAGEPLSKKKIKQTYPELMKNALFYFPSWEHAIQSIET